MNQKIFLILGLLLVASGCMSSSADNSSSFHKMVAMGEVTNHSITYSVKTEGLESPGTLEKTNTERRQKIVSIKTGAGGTFTTEAYKLENHTVTCKIQPSAGSRDVTCLKGPQEGLHRILDIESWDIKSVNITGMETVSGKDCFRFSVRPGDIEKLGYKVSDMSVCMDTKSGAIIQLNASTEEGNISITAQRLSEPGKIELRRPVGLITHCTDSYDFELTPFKPLDTAVLSVNDYNRTVELPERFETRFYKVPEKHIDPGENTVTVFAGGTSFSEKCFRRD